MAGNVFKLRRCSDTTKKHRLAVVRQSHGPSSVVVMKCCWTLCQKHFVFDSETIHKVVTR